MTWLAIDTTGPVCAAALIDGEGPDPVVAARSENIGRGHAEHLPIQITELLNDSSLRYGDLAGIAVTAGPGSFTGVRVGIAMARGLALARDIPAIGIDGLEAMIETVRASNHGVTDGSGLIVAARDARRGQIFARAERVHRGTAPFLPSAACRPDRLLRKLAGAAAAQTVILVGSAAAAAAENLAAHSVSAKVASPADVPAMAQLARLARQNRGTSPPLPLYLREPDAQPQAATLLSRQPYEPGTDR